VQVDPIKPVAKAPGTILLKQRCDGPLSNLAFKFNLRHHKLGAPAGADVQQGGGGGMPMGVWTFPTLVVESTTAEEDAKLHAPVA